MSSNQRPDTLMQDRSYQFDENLLRRTAGPYIRVKRVGFPMSDVGPVYLHHRTCPEPVGTSHLGQQQTMGVGGSSP